MRKMDWAPRSVQPCSAPPGYWSPAGPRGGQSGLHYAEEEEVEDRAGDWTGLSVLPNIGGVHLKINN